MTEDEGLACAAMQARSLATRLELRADAMFGLCREMEEACSRIEDAETDAWACIAKLVDRVQAIYDVIADTQSDVRIDLETLCELVESVEEAGE